MDSFTTNRSLETFRVSRTSITLTSPRPRRRPTSRPVSVAAVASTWPCSSGAKFSTPVTTISTSASVRPAWCSITSRFWRVPLARL
ncbi:hypothetical protein G6F22_021355 [Rhizopus arrhizus]|nr:hypothetical protein G6F22_021355 [Rhizopus arrhizus]